MNHPIIHPCFATRSSPLRPVTAQSNANFHRQSHLRHHPIFPSPLPPSNLPFLPPKALLSRPLLGNTQVPALKVTIARETEWALSRTHLLQSVRKGKRSAIIVSWITTKINKAHHVVMQTHHSILIAVHTEMEEVGTHLCMTAKHSSPLEEETFVKSPRVLSDAEATSGL